MSHMQQLQADLPAVYGHCVVAFNSNLAFPLNVLCRTDRQTDSKINMTPRVIGLTQTSVASRKSATKLEQTERVFKKLSGKEEKHNMSTSGRSLWRIVGWLRGKKVSCLVIIIHTTTKKNTYRKVI